MSPLDFNLPKNNSNVIKVIGVGGGGSNAVNYMYSKGIQGVDFVVCNTDSQALGNSPIPTKIQLGASLTEGLGAGANPEVGEQSALESAAEISDMFGEKTKMVFITVGMGGGTGTGAAPIIAKLAQERGLLTVGIVTTPFSFEGKTRNEQAQKGIDKLRDNVDSLIVINNNKLREVYGNLGFKAGFSKADEVLATAARGIAEVITHHYTQNIDFRDAKTVLEKSGSAIMGSAKARGENRAQEAITKALESPLLNDNKITGAQNVLLLIVSGTEEVNEITIDEIGEINDYIQSEAKTNVNIIMGVGEDESLGDEIAVTIVATGFNIEQQEEIAKVETKKIVYDLEGNSIKSKTTFSSKKKSEIKDTDKPIAKKEARIVHKLEDDTLQIVDKKTGQISLFDIDVSDMEFISKKSVKVVDNEKKGFLGKEISSALSELKKVKNESNYTLEEELIPTTQILKETPVIYEEVIEEEFIITQDIANIEVVDFKIITPKQEEKLDTLAFDLPIEQVFETKKQEVTNDLDEAKQIDVINTEIVSKNKVYSLEDFEDLEKKLEQAKPVSKKQVRKEEIAPELDFTTKVIQDTSKIAEIEVSDETEISPLSMTISELKSRTEIRKNKFKKHNHKFRNANKNNIDELEKQPAYKRNNIELDDTDSSVNKSRTTINLDGDDINLRSNNSYLHDNVD